LKSLVLASQNKKKVEEFQMILEGLFIIPFSARVEETGRTFLENALMKARGAALVTNQPTLAEDSGLCVEALGGAPGIHSSRFAPDDSSRIQKLLHLLKAVTLEKRGAYFVCALVLVSPNGSLLFSTEKRCDGKIAFEPKGAYGFGYDPIFYLPQYKRTMAELPPKEKNRISHRGQALRELKSYLKGAY
jgi:XTP/dITP diphosphohydrolase